MADQIREILSTVFDSDLQNVSDAIIIAMAVVLGLIVIMTIFALIVQIVLAIKYVKYNRKENSTTTHSKTTRSKPAVRFSLATATAIISKKSVCAVAPGKRLR